MPGREGLADDGWRRRRRAESVAAAEAALRIGSGGDRGAGHRRAGRLGALLQPLPRERGAGAAAAAPPRRPADAAVADAPALGAAAGGGQPLRLVPDHPRDVPRVPPGRLRPARAEGHPGRASSGARSRLVSVETRRASPFASSLMFDYIASYMYEGDAPQGSGLRGCLRQPHLGLGASCRARSSASARARASSSRRASSATRRRSSSAARASLRLADLQRAQRQHRLEPGPDRGGDHVGRLGAVDDEVAGPAAAGQLEEALADPLVERQRLGLQPVRRLDPAPAPRRRAGRAARSGAAAGRRSPTGTAAPTSVPARSRPAPW